MGVHKPSNEQIKHWIDVSLESLDATKKALTDGLYAREGISMQSVCSGNALDQQSLARALFLRGDRIDKVREVFVTAGEYQIRNFSIAYDESDPEYAGENRDLSTLLEIVFLRGMNGPLMGCNFERAKYLAALYQTSPDGYMMDIDVNRFCHALKHCALGEFNEARKYRDLQFADYKKKPPKKLADRNYYLRFLTLSALLDGNETMFNVALKQQADFYYKHEAIREYKNTSYEFVCDDCVSLANLGLHHGLKVTVEHHLIPDGLLLK